MTTKPSFTRSALMANVGAVATSLRIASKQEALYLEQRYSQMITPGAEPLLPVSAALKGFSVEQYRQAHKNFSPNHFLMGGDDALIYNSHLNHFLPSSSAKPHQVGDSLPRNIKPLIGDLSISGEQTPASSLNDYIYLADSRVQGLIIVQAGEVVFERYPGMTAEQNHVWMGLSSLAISLVFALLITEGKIDVDRSVSVYLPELRCTAWDGVTIRQALNGNTGLDLSPTQHALFDPKSYISRFIAAEFGRANSYPGHQESWLDVVKQIKKFTGVSSHSQQGISPVSQTILAYIAETIDQLPWTQLFENRVWGRVKAKAPILVTLAPDGTALCHDFILSTLEDAARMGMLLCPSGSTISASPVLPSSVIKSFRTSSKIARNSALHAFKFDKCYDDGSRYLQGSFGQGMYIDAKRDFVAVYFSSKPFEPLDKPSCLMEYLRAVSQQFH
ncbi:serine hydrolase domain-containing protein [Agarivorans sp. Alg241-V36]|uniref:serine hydrolase n=1 Tax=Agarivorans sp. Alg241-V36 TaxID=2305992 RepID=UPI0013D7E545|nr:serine hydrolase domain-containing protein [Agarivorans sp. Alg241-V36]